MALIQSKQAKEEAPVAVVLMAGIETVNIYDVDLSAGLTGASDEVEVALLPANSIITGITLIGAGTGVITADFGIMDGEWRQTGDRTIATVLMNDVDLNGAVAEGVVDTLTDVAAVDKNRSLGLTFSGNIAAGSASVKAVVRTIMA